MAQPSPRSPAFQAMMVTIEWLALVLFAGLFVTGAVAIVANVTAGPWWLALLLVAAVPLGMVAADLATGFGHFFADNFCAVDTPIIGHALVFRFRQHHDHQNIICTLSFRELNGGLAAVAMPVLIGGVLLARQGGTAETVGAALCMSTALFVTATNQVHRWSHERAPAAVRWLQRRGWILSPTHHSVHHKAPHDLHFCITLGWLNPQLDRLGLWHRLSDALVALGVPQAEESVMGTARQRSGAGADRRG